MPRRARAEKDRAKKDDEKVESSAGPRGFWSGTLTFGLVSIPVELFPAVRTARPGLRMLSDEGVPLSRVYVRDDGSALDNDELVHGFEVDDTFVLLTDEELDALEPERSRDIHLRRFVPRSALSPARVRRAYLLAPGGESTRPYAVLAKTMEESERAGIATFVMRGKEYIVAIVSDRSVLRALILRFDAELRTVDAIGLPELVEAPATLTGAMTAAIRSGSQDELPEDALEDIRSSAMRALAEKKRKAKEDVVEVPELVEESDEAAAEETTDLVALLKRRLKGATSGERRSEAPPASTELEGATKADLYERAQALDVEGRSQMNKAQLIEAIRKAEAA
ncbi:MAG: Ku protein [Sandaracinaceae bacterium]